MVGLTTHKLKLSADYYDDSASGVKTFEIRKNDRNFKVGDILELREWLWSALEGKGAYTGNVHWKIITYILEDEAFLKEGYVCIALAPIAEPEGNHERWRKRTQYNEEARLAWERAVERYALTSE